MPVVTQPVVSEYETNVKYVTFAVFCGWIIDEVWNDDANTQALCKENKDGCRGSEV